MNISTNTTVTVQLNAEGIEVLRQSYLTICDPRIYRAGVDAPKIDDVMDQMHPNWRTCVVRMELWRWANVFGGGFDMMRPPVCQGVEVDPHDEFVTIKDEEITGLLMNRLSARKRTDAEHNLANALQAVIFERKHGQKP